MNEIVYKLPLLLAGSKTVRASEVSCYHDMPFLVQIILYLLGSIIIIILVTGLLAVLAMAIQTGYRLLRGENLFDD